MAKKDPPFQNNKPDRLSGPNPNFEAHGGAEW